jgi:HPt (histidine-containing phosphotransfer) domain-containing protein
VLSQLRELGVESNTDLMGELIALFAVETPPLVAAIRAAIAAGDGDGLKRAAHTLKGTSSSLGAHELAHLSAELERLGRAGHTGGAPALLVQLEHEYARVVGALEVERQGAG